MRSRLSVRGWLGACLSNDRRSEGDPQRADSGDRFPRIAGYYVRATIAGICRWGAAAVGERYSDRLLVAGVCLATALTVGVAHADQQQDPGLKAVVQQAISEAECFTDHYDSAVWYTLMEPRLRRIVKDKDERLAILKQVYCETHRPGQTRLPPGLVMGVMEIESRFDRYAVSSAAAVGLMQVMPFWPERLGMRRYELVRIEPNIRMGCAILRFYLDYEHNDVRKALARYNGSIGRRDYPDKVINAWTRWNGADDLGFPPLQTQAQHRH